jgi:citronellol/citronellal dehydrogenase
MSLRGRVLFVTGASRGIGKAIALRAARDGAAVVIASKTDTPHRTLPGTIHTAAEEIRAAGGTALPLVVDVRDEHAVQQAVDRTVEVLGRLDILVNNASAIHLANTVETPMKRFDLMFGVNVRGTYVASQAALPHLLRSDHAHILNISPPLDLRAKWFAPHVAYTMSKYGMSMCVLGMAEEYRGRVAVNALWPRTTIATAAVQMLGGASLMEASRRPEIMADAAHVLLSRAPSEGTGGFHVDEDVLRATGVTDFAPYDVTPGVTPTPDWFL